MRDELLFEKNTLAMKEVEKFWDKNEVSENILYYDMSRVLEDLVAKLGDYPVVRAYDRDFDNKIKGDLKCSVTFQKGKSRHWYLDITVSPGKAGSLQILVMNVPANRIDKFIIPREEWLKMLTGQNRREKFAERGIYRTARIECQYNIDTDEYSKIQKYRIDLPLDEWAKLGNKPLKIENEQASLIYNRYWKPKKKVDKTMEAA